LSSIVAPCDLVNTKDLNKAYRYLYGSCSPIGGIDENMQVSFAKSLRKPHWSLMPEWHAQQAVHLSYEAEEMGIVQVSFVPKGLLNQCVVKSAPLKNGIYSFYIFNPSSVVQKVSVPIYASLVFKNKGEFEGNIVCTDKLQNNSLVTFYIHNNYLFLKHIRNDQVISIISIEGSGVFSVCIQSDHGGLGSYSQSVVFKLGDQLQ